MSLQDPISDMLTRVFAMRSSVENKQLTMPSSKLKAAICEILETRRLYHGL